jgi:aspartyl-tRNA(Asn)/glutamyl-tRNA(Gln) amidotransferase subunit C
MAWLRKWFKRTVHFIFRRTVKVEEVQKIAALAHLSITEEEKQQYAEDMSKVLRHFDQLDELDVADVEPTTTTSTTVTFREDVVQPSLPPESWLSNTPAKVGTAISVPKVLP